METFPLELSLLEALSLFNVVTAERAQRTPEVDAIEERLRGYLYECLSIEEMEDPARLCEKLRAEQARRRNIR